VLLRLPCGPALLDAAVRAGVEALEAALGQPVDDAAPPGILVGLIAERAAEASRGALRSASLPGLAVVALGQALLCGGRDVMAALDPTLDARARLARAAFDGRPPQEQAELARELARRLRRELAQARVALEGRVGPRPGVELPEQLLSGGLLLLRRHRPSPSDGELVGAAIKSPLPAHRVAEILEHPEQRASSEDEARIHRALLRWELGQALLDRLVLLTRGEAGWLSPSGPLPEDAAGQLLVPRGDVPADAVVVAVRLDALQRAAVHAAASPTQARAAVDRAWADLIADQPRALHQRVAGLGISAFTTCLDALEFAERATRTLSGPRLLMTHAEGPTTQVGADARVAAGVCTGALWGGTDGGAVDLDGPAVAAAIALACVPLRADGAAAGLPDPDRDGGVRCSGDTWRDALVEARREGREARCGDPDASGRFEHHAVAGWWQARGRRQVFLRRPDCFDDPDGVELVSVDAAALDALLAVDPAGAQPTVDGASSAQRRLDVEAWQQRRLHHDAATDPLGAAPLFGDDPAVAAAVDDQPAAALDPLDGFDPVLPPEPDDVTEEALQEGLAGTLSDLDVPAWDATGFSLPQYSQEISQQDLLGEGPGDPGAGYVLEVDDDYGFDEEDDGVQLPDSDTVEVDPTAHADPRAAALAPIFQDEEPPTLRGARMQPDDFDVFALTENSDTYTSESTGSWLAEDLSGPQSGGLSSVSGGLSGGSAPVVDDVEIIDLEDDIEVSLPSEELWLDADDPSLSGEDSAGQTSETEEEPRSGGLSSGGSLVTPADAPPADAARADAAASGDARADDAGSDDAGGTMVLPEDALPVAAGDDDEPRRPVTAVSSSDIATLFDGYVVVCDGTGCYTFGLRDGRELRDAHSYETGGDGDAAYRAFVQAKVAEGFVPRLDLWSPLPTDVAPQDLDVSLLQQAWQATLTS